MPDAFSTPATPFRISSGTVRAARREKPNACERLGRMAVAVAELLGVESRNGQMSTWIDVRANLDEPRTAEELAAQFRQQYEAGTLPKYYNGMKPKGATK
jgi:hypothetical protein